MQKAESIFSVSQLAQSLKGTLETRFNNIWLRGEVSNVKTYPSGHSYFTLKDESSQISSIIFRDQQSKDASLVDGLKIVVFGRVTVYEARGQLQIVVYQWIPDGLGELQLAFQERKKRLAAEGLFAVERKKKLPFYVEKIGLVTSIQGAVLLDILQILKQRQNNQQIFLFPIPVQGALSAPIITQTLQFIAQTQKLDVLVLARGGGSIEDLWAFNDETVVRTLGQMPFCVVSAIGHETDFTLCDFIADVRAETPTAAALLVSQLTHEWLEHLQKQQQGFMTHMQRQLNLATEKLFWLKKQFKSPQTLYRELSLKLSFLAQKMNQGLQNQFVTAQNRILQFKTQFRLLSPLQVLSRGYTFLQAEDTQQIITSVELMQKNKNYQLVFADGKKLIKIVE